MYYEVCCLETTQLASKMVVKNEFGSSWVVHVEFTWRPEPKILAILFFPLPLCSGFLFSLWCLLNENLSFSSIYHLIDVLTRVSLNFVVGISQLPSSSLQNEVRFLYCPLGEFNWYCYKICDLLTFFCFLFLVLLKPADGRGCKFFYSLIWFILISLTLWSVFYLQNLVCWFLCWFFYLCRWNICFSWFGRIFNSVIISYFDQFMLYYHLVRERYFGSWWWQNLSTWIWVQQINLRYLYMKFSSYIWFADLLSSKGTRPFLMEFDVCASFLPQIDFLLHCFWLLMLDGCLICFSIWSSCHTQLLQTGKNEEEEFNTGPLSVLMMSVKNNTQVCFFSMA